MRGRSLMVLVMLWGAGGCRSATPAQAPPQPVATHPPAAEQAWLPPTEDEPAPAQTVEPQQVCAHIVAMGELPNTPDALQSCTASMSTQVEQRGTDNWTAYADCILRGDTPSALRQCDAGYGYSPDSDVISTGIPECDELYSRTLCALDSLGDQEVRLQARDAFKQAAAAWKDMAGDAATRQTAADACKQALAAGDSGWSAVGC